ncbi:MAG: adenylate/guanylate cyclase domain-containing protein, partial [Planctomycetaceae bacterium]|nr:adenylate/guanylate cyclase domain-containing protein [Planctomycetaceae bacterium]
MNADLQSLVKSDFQHFHDSLEQSSSDETDNCIAVIAKRLETDHVMKKQFTRIIPPELLDAMFKRGEIQLGGERVRGALLFLDIRGFTAIAQRRDPEQVVDILNKFFSRAVPVIERSGGIVDKFVGDGLLALFGIPKSLGNNALCAIQAAIELQDLTKTLNEEKLYGDDIQVDVGIGVAKGNVIAGTIGS